MKLYKSLLLCPVIFQPFCFGMELDEEIQKNCKEIKPSLERKRFEEIENRDFYPESIRIDKATQEYQEAMRLWDIDMPHALRHMLKAEKLEHKEAKEKLKEIRKLKTYSEPKMASKNDFGMLLKFFEISPKAQYNAVMDWQGINKQYALDYFFELAECEDTPKNIKKQAIEQLTKIRKTNGYRKPSTVQSAAQCNNIGYLLYEKENKHSQPSFTKKNAKNANASVQHSKNTNGKKINSTLDSGNDNKSALKNKYVNHKYVSGQFHQGTEYCNRNNSQETFKSSQVVFSQPKDINEKEMEDDIYSKIQGISPDSEETLRYFNIAIHQITMETQFSLGMMYFQGHGVEKDLGKALTYFKLAADQGHAYAQFNLGAMYFEALGVSQDLEQTVKYFKLSANQKYAQAQFSLGMMYFQGLGVTQNLEKAARCFKLAADQGNVEAQFTLSGMYHKGQGVKKSSKKTLKYCKLAALQGHQQAQFSVGIMYYEGHGGKQDFGEAIRYLVLSADQGHTEAQFNLGVIYSEDERIENNFEEALKYYKLAADQGHAEAQFNLGVMYYSAEGVENLDEAVRFFTLAANQGHIEAQFNLGVIYYSPEGGEQDLEKTFRWFKLAADQGFAEAQFNLGVMYSEAQGVEQDLKETLKYYKLAADQGHAEAQFNLGLMYYNAEGVEEDLYETVRYFTLAADQGHEEAQSYLDSMDANVSGIEKNKNMNFPSSLNSAAQEDNKFFNQISMVPQQTSKNESSDLFLGEINTSGSLAHVKKTLMVEENRRRLRKTQSLNNLKSSHSSFENFEGLPINTQELESIKISGRNSKNKGTTNKFRSIINFAPSSKEDESLVQKKKKQKKNKAPNTTIKLINHSNQSKKSENCNSLNNFDHSICNESIDYSSSEKSLTDTPFELLFKSDGKRDENLKHLKKLLNNRDLRKASEIKLNRSIVVRVLRELGPNGTKTITWNLETNGNKNRNKISADIIRQTNNVNNSKIPSLNIHLHSPRGKWYDDVNIKNHFLDFIRFCDPEVNALIEEIERK